MPLRSATRVSPPGITSISSPRQHERAAGRCGGPRGGRRPASGAATAARPPGRCSRAGRPRSACAAPRSSSSRGRRADQHAVARPTPPTGLTTSWSSRSSTCGPLVVVPQQVGRHVGEDRLLAEVVADEVGHVGVHRLVVGDAVADRVGDGDVAGPGRGHQPGHPEDGVAAERRPGRGTRRRCGGR